MKNIFSKKAVIILAAAVILVFLSLITLSLGSGNSDALSGAEGVLMKPVKSVMTSFIGSLEKIYGYMFKYDQIVAENNELKARVAKLEEDYRDYTAISNENEQLKELLGLTSRRSDFKLEQSMVVSWTASSFASTFTISKGTKSGISLNDCVITETGYLVGRVTEVSDTTATVTTLLDTSSSIGALVYTSGEIAVCEGDYKLFSEGCAKLAYLANGAQIATGDTVITSGRGGNIPHGLVMGHIKDVYNTSGGSADYASIEPAADIENLSYVYIITEFDAAD